jgi:hypothetical protein
VRAARRVLDPGFSDCRIICVVAVRGGEEQRASRALGRVMLCVFEWHGAAAAVCACVPPCV